MTKSRDRREFVQGLGFAVLTVLSVPRIAHASGSPPDESNEGADSLTIHSSPGLVSHVHDVLIPYAVLKAPPRQGMEFTTTQALFHRHNIVLTQEQLSLVNQGGTVTKKASSHLFVITLSRGSGS